MTKYMTTWQVFWWISSIFKIAIQDDICQCWFILPSIITLSWCSTSVNGKKIYRTILQVMRLIRLIGIYRIVDHVMSDGSAFVWLSVLLCMLSMWLNPGAIWIIVNIVCYTLRWRQNWKTKYWKDKIRKDFPCVLAAQHMQR